MAYELKTKLNDASVQEFLESVEDSAKREDCFKILDIMQEVTGCQPKMWGKNIIGLGQYHYVYSSGQEGDWMLTGFSPRKSYISVYLMSGMVGAQMDDQLAKLGKHKMGKSCLNIKRLEDVDETVLAGLIQDSVTYMKDQYQTRC